MNWNKLEESGQIEEIKKLSFEKPVLIFKHSTSCGISGMSLNRLLRNWQEADSEKMAPYYLDLLAFRSISDQVAREFHVPHQSPQVLVIRNGEAAFDTSHFNISYSAVMDKV